MSNNPYSSPEQTGISSPLKKPPMFSWLGCGLMVAVVAVLIGLFFPATRNIREPARRAQCQNNLKQIALALHNYEARHGSLPPAYTVDADRKPLHSWRTYLLPYLEQQALFDSIDLTKPWDDPVNAGAFMTAVSVFTCPSATTPENHTTYLAVVAPDSCFRPGEPVRFSEITDSRALTLTVIELTRDQSVPWMSPQDADEPMVLKLFSAKKMPHPGRTNAACVDGNIESFGNETSPEKIRAMISISGEDDRVANDFNEQ